MMTSKDAYDIALNIADKAMRQLQFFVAICIAFGGWTFVGETIAGLDLWEPKRFLIAAVFTAPTLGLLVGTIDALKRLNAALDVSREIFEKENNGLSEAAKRLHVHGNVWRARIVMSVTILLIDAVILLYGGGNSDQVLMSF